MRRSEFCKVVDIEPGAFKGLRQKGLLPFDETTEAKDGAGRIWSRLTIHHAATMIAADDLVASQSLSWAGAQAILRGGRGMADYSDSPILAGTVLHPDDQGSDVHFVRVEFLQLDGRVSDAVNRFTVYHGSPEAIMSAAADRVRAFNKRAAFASNRIEIASMAGVNLSRAYRIARSRMEALGVESNPEGALDPEGTEGNG